MVVFVGAYLSTCVWRSGLRWQKVSWIVINICGCLGWPHSSKNLINTAV